MGDEQDKPEEKPRPPVDRDWIKHDILRKRREDFASKDKKNKKGGR